MTDTHCGAHGFLVLFRDGVDVISSPSLTLLPHTSGKDIYTLGAQAVVLTAPPGPQSTSVSLPSSLQKSLAIKSFTLHHHILHLFFFFKHNLPAPSTFATACPQKTHCLPHVRHRATLKQAPTSIIHSQQHPQSTTVSTAPSR